MDVIKYDVIIPTKDRHDALLLSLPSILNNQEKTPQNIIIVDSSIDKSNTIQSLNIIRDMFHVDIKYIETDKQNSSYQRNLGLEHSGSDIIIFPDDDSIFFPGSIDEMLKIYEKDYNKDISGVCAAESLEPPPGFNIKNVYNIKKTEILKKQIGRLRYKIENNIVQDPFKTIGKEFADNSKYIPWIESENAVKVEYMTGFRMSFRSEAIKKYKFEENFKAYCLGEDIEASFSAYKEGALIGARNAKIYHHKYPSARGNGFDMGIWHILNRAYIVAKHSKFNKEYCREVKFYTLYKILIYTMGINKKFGRERLNGSIVAYKNITRLFQCNNLDSLSKEYLTIIDKLEFDRG